MIRILKIVMCMLIAFIAITPISVFAEESEIQLTENSETGYYEYNATANGFYSSRSDVLTPAYYIFAGNKTLQEANKLVTDLEMMDQVKEWGSTIVVINPKDVDEGYTEKDLATFENVIKSAPIKNVKIIGIDDGATFANDYISQRCNYVAGMLLINGSMKENLKEQSVVPVYLSNASEISKEYYKNINDVNQSTSYEDYTVYQNSLNNLQAVSISKNEETLAQAFDHAWDSIFSKNYRFHNSQTEFYSLPILNDKVDTLSLEFDLAQVTIFDELNMTYNEMVHQKVTNMPGNDYAWFEYIPNTVLNSKKGTIPLVITLHGNQNDPRIQGDTTGWIELAAQENFMVISPEYQNAQENGFFTQDGNTNIYGTVDGLGVDGISYLIQDLKIKYPQIDSSKIYVTGLSQGGALTSLLGIKNNNIFAAAASVSGVNAYHSDIDQLVENYQGHETAYLYMCGDHDFFQMIPVDGSSQHGSNDLYGFNIWETDENVHIFSALNAYQKINGLEPTQMDMSLNPYFGIKLENEHWTKLGSRDMLEGQLSNDKGVIMQLSAVKNLAHWNDKNEAEYIWNFFKNYQRNTETGELIYINQKDNSNENQTPVEDDNIHENDNKHEDDNKDEISTQDANINHGQETGAKNTNVVNTGDSTNYVIYMLCMLISVFTLVVMFIKEKINY